MTGGFKLSEMKPEPMHLLLYLLGGSALQMAMIYLPKVHSHTLMAYSWYFYSIPTCYAYRISLRR